MTVPFDAARPEDGALGLYGAVGDALAGRPAGFGRRRAALAARFARHRGLGDDAVAANWYAGLLAEIGHVAVVVPPGADDRRRTLALADAPLYGARMVSAVAGIPPHAADIVRWHREHDDGTGFPDRLRWDGIPADAGSLGIVTAFLGATDDADEPRGPGEALFAILTENGRHFRVELVRTFREFITQSAADWDAPADVPAAPFDDAALLAMLAERLDERSPRTAGRSVRVAALARALAERLGADGARAQRLARLLALGNAVAEPDDDDFDPLSRFARDRRAEAASRAAELVAGIAAYEADAELLGLVCEWHRDRRPDLLAAVVGLASTVDAMEPHDAPRLVAAASGTQFDPAVAQAYLAGVGAAT
jgi:HD domain